KNIRICQLIPKLSTKNKTHLGVSLWEINLSLCHSKVSLLTGHPVYFQLNNYSLQALHSKARQQRQWIFYVPVHNIRYFGLVDKVAELFEDCGNSRMGGNSPDWKKSFFCETRNLDQ